MSHSSSSRPQSASLSWSALVVFRLDDQRFGLRLETVERIVRSAEIAVLPKAPEIVLGVIDVHGALLPVVDMRRRFRLPPRELMLSDHLIVARTARRRVVLIVDGVLGVFERREASVVSAEAIAPGLEYVEGVMRLEDGMIFIHDLNSFLSLAEEARLDESLGALASKR